MKCEDVGPVEAEILENQKQDIVINEECSSPSKQDERKVEESVGISIEEILSPMT